MAEKEKTNVTGLETATNKKAAEYDLVTALLKAADFRNDESTEVEIRRGGEYLFTVHVRAVSDSEGRTARKNATRYGKNPAGKGYPPIEKEYNSAEFNSWLIYIATTEEDKEKIWGNKAVMDKLGAVRPVDTIDMLLSVGEKMELVRTIEDISGMNGDDEEEEVAPEEYAKN